MFIVIDKDKKPKKDNGKYEVVEMGDLSPHFNRSEFACKCGKCDAIAVDYELVEVLEKLREHCGQPITITSSYRCAKQNKAVKGAPKSKHRLGIAADIQVKNFPARDIAAYFRNEYPTKYGVGEYETFTHIDTRKEPARWQG